MKVFYKILLIIFIITSMFFIWTRFNEEKVKDEKIKEEVVYKKVREDAEEKNIINEYQKEFNNEDVIGEITIENADFIVPFAHGDDNNYYLKHLLDKTPNYLGSLFLDYRNSINDKKIIIYGHNSTYKYTGFNILEKYLKKDYYLNHSNIQIRTENDIYNYKIFSVYIAKDDLSHVNLKFNDYSYVNHLRHLKNSSIYNTDVDVDNEYILVLQTCFNGAEDSYVVICAKKI